MSFVEFNHRFNDIFSTQGGRWKVEGEFAEAVEAPTDLTVVEEKLDFSAALESVQTKFDVAFSYSVKELKIHYTEKSLRGKME